jgi:glycosyltransferase involved in cell wall biosynthesis
MATMPSNNAKRQSRVAALVPAYNASRFIQTTLDSLSAQAWPALDILVSVDRSDDDTLAICREHAKKDARFKVFGQTERLGWINNSNFLLEQAQADYALFAFHDDQLLPGYIEKLANVLDGESDVVLAYSDLELTKLNGTRKLCTYAALDGLQDRVERASTLLAREKYWWVPVHGMFRLDRARRIGGLKHHGAGEFSADWPWMVHMSLLGAFRRVPETLCSKIFKPDSLSPNWQFSEAQWKEVSASCMREIWNSELTAQEKTALMHPLLADMSAGRSGAKTFIREIKRRFRARR